MPLLMFRDALHSCTRTKVVFSTLISRTRNSVSCLLFPWSIFKDNEKTMLTQRYPIRYTIRLSTGYFALRSPRIVLITVEIPQSEKDSQDRAKTYQVLQKPRNIWGFWILNFDIKRILGETRTHSNPEDHSLPFVEYRPRGTRTNSEFSRNLDVR